MARVRCVHSDVTRLGVDLDGIAAGVHPRLAVAVRRNVSQGNNAARRFARGSSGKHGSSYYKRISGEMTGELVGEWGPTGEVEGRAVGAGYRHASNTDMARSQDVQGPKFGADVRKVLDGLFW